MLIIDDAEIFFSLIMFSVHFCIFLYRYRAQKWNKHLIIQKHQYKIAARICKKCIP